MSIPHKNLTIDDLKTYLSYDPETGVFTWIAKAGNVSKVGEPTGYIDANGYVIIGFARKLHKAHRLAWLYMTGAFPRNQIDHMNGDRTDNRFCNLREATHSQNMRNFRSAASDSKTKVLGVGASGKRYRARISVDGKTIYLGLFDTPEGAHHAYLEAKRKLHDYCTI